LTKARIHLSVVSSTTAEFSRSVTLSIQSLALGPLLSGRYSCTVYGLPSHLQEKTHRRICLVNLCHCYLPYLAPAFTALHRYCIVILHFTLLHYNVSHCAALYSGCVLQILGSLTITDAYDLKSSYVYGPGTLNVAATAVMQFVSSTQYFRYNIKVMGYVDLLKRCCPHTRAIAYRSM
jgi:hypothetical protein